MGNSEIEMQNMTPEVKLIVSDVDETIADNYTLAEPEMIKELTTLFRRRESSFYGYWC